MELSTKKLFSSLKNSPKRKFKVNNNTKLSVPNVLIDKISNNINTNLKNKLFFKTSNLNKNNPFYNTSKLNDKKKQELQTSKKQKINNDLLKLNDSQNQSSSYEDSSQLFSSESDSIFEKDKIKDNKDKKEVNKCNNKAKTVKFDVDNLCNLFKSSNLKSTIVIDDKGNNNLNLEQKKFINDYFSQKGKKDKNKINTIPVQNYKENNKLFKQKTPYNNNNTKVFFKKNNVAEKSLSILKTNNETINKRRTQKMINHKKLKSTKNMICVPKLFLSHIPKETSEIDSHSVFENCTNRSIDSSFLGSCLNDEFYQNFAEVN
jgi:hypothetical protein